MSTFQDHLRQAAAARAAVQAKAESIVPANARAACIANEIVYDNDVVLVHFIVSPGFPYDNGKWRVATIDRWGPRGHESSNSAGKPFMTIYEALVDILYSHPKAVIAEFIDAQGQRHTLIPEFACDAQGRSTLGDYLDQYSPVKQPRPCEEAYRRLNIEPYSFSALAAEKYLWLEQHHSPGIPVPTPDMAQSMIATALLEAAGGTIAGLHAEVDEMRRTCGIRHTPEGLPFGYEALLGAADYLQQTRPGLGFFPMLPLFLTAAGAAAAYGVTKTKAYAESLLSGIGFPEVDTEETIVLLHGTSSWNLESIARTGLSSHRVCLTDNEAVAEEFGKVTLLEDHDNYEIMKRHPDSRPLPQEPFLAILRVTVTNLNQLRADPVMNRNPVTQVLVEKYGIDNENDFRQAVKRGEIELPKNEKDWRGSLRAVSSVEYKGVIPPENLDIWYEDRWIPLLMKSWNPPFPRGIHHIRRDF